MTEYEPGPEFDMLKLLLDMQWNAAVHTPDEETEDSPEDAEYWLIHKTLIEQMNELIARLEAQGVFKLVDLDKCTDYSRWPYEI